MLKYLIQYQELMKQDTEWHQTGKCKCRLDASMCHNKWLNDDKGRCECKELIGKGVCDKDLFEILVIASMNVINHVMLVNIWIIKTVSAKKN